MSERVLIADPIEERAEQIAEACRARGMVCTVETGGATVLERALTELPAALVAHLDLPIIGGAKLAEIVDANPRAHGIRILLTGDPSCVEGEETDRVITSDRNPEAVAACVEALLAEDSTRPQGDDSAEDSVVEGELSQLPLTDLLQLFHVSRRTGMVEVEHHERRPYPVGRIYLRGGDIVQAVVGLVEGEKALYRLLAWNRGSFSFRPSPVTITALIETPTRALLREGQRQQREWERLAAELLPMDAHVSLVIQADRLPNVMHPLTQEVLVVLELYSRVRDVVDHCTFPDYQVLRTLQTLLGRGMIDVRREPAVIENSPGGEVFSITHANRLREWLAHANVRGGTPRDAKLLVIAPDHETTRNFCRLIERLPGLQREGTEVPAVDDLTCIGRLAVDAEVGIEFIHLPIATRFSPLWPVVGHGALGVLVPISAPVEHSANAVRRVARELRKLPRTRIFLPAPTRPRRPRGAGCAAREHLSTRRWAALPDPPGQRREDGDSDAGNVRQNSAVRRS